MGTMNSSMKENQMSRKKGMTSKTPRKEIGFGLK
jgi:hypothetical protein